MKRGPAGGDTLYDESPHFLYRRIFIWSVLTWCCTQLGGGRAKQRPVQKEVQGVASWKCDTWAQLMRRALINARNVLGTVLNVGRNLAYRPQKSTTAVLVVDIEQLWRIDEHSGRRKVCIPASSNESSQITSTCVPTSWGRWEDYTMLWKDKLERIHGYVMPW
jgi:hypothetical protein